MARKKLQPTKIMLLEAARTALAEKGHSEFSMRNIAKAAGVHLRTVQYYFPTRRDLLTDVLEYTMSAYYLGQYPIARSNFAGLSPEKKFETVVGFLFDDTKEPFVCQFFPEIWALASRGCGRLRGVGPVLRASQTKHCRDHCRGQAGAVCARGGTQSSYRGNAV